MFESKDRLNNDERSCKDKSSRKNRWMEEKKKKKNVIKIVNQEEISLSKNWREEKIYDPSLKKKTSDK